MDKRLKEMSLAELLDILQTKTRKLLDAIERKASSEIIRDYAKEVAEIQRAIKERDND